MTTNKSSVIEAFINIASAVVFVWVDVDMAILHSTIGEPAATVVSHLAFVDIRAQRGSTIFLVTSTTTMESTDQVGAFIVIPVKGSTLCQILDRAVLIAKIAEVHATLTVATLAILRDPPVDSARWQVWLL